MSVIRKFRKSLIIATAALMIVGIFASTALAFSAGTTITVSPGARVCLPAQYAYSYANFEGHASKGSRFLVLWGYTASDVSNEIYRTPTDTITDMNASFNRTYNPYYFPGYFRLCVRNTNTTSITATLLQSGN